MAASNAPAPAAPHASGGGMFTGFLRSGDPFIWMTGGTLAFSLLMIAALIWVVGANALGFFWPDQLRAVDLRDGQKLLGAVRAREAIPQSVGDGQEQYRTQFQVANRDLYGADFRWVDDSLMTGHTFPEQVMYLERYEWGPFFGFLTTVRQDGEIVAEGFEQAWPKFLELHARTQATLDNIHSIEKKDIGDINYELEHLRIEVKRRSGKRLIPPRPPEKLPPLRRPSPLCSRPMRKRPKNSARYTRKTHAITSLCRI